MPVHVRGLRDRVGRSATGGSEPFRVTHADEPIADKTLASTFGQMHGKNVINGVIRDGTGIHRACDAYSPLTLPDAGHILNAMGDTRSHAPVETSKPARPARLRRRGRRAAPRFR